MHKSFMISNSGGFHNGIGVVDAKVLNDTIKNPDKYNSRQTLRFSKCVIGAPEWQQNAALNRTAYGV